jgi:hypothetical protein
MRHLTLLVLIILLAAMPSCKFFKGKKLFGKKADTMVVWQARQDSLRLADSLNKVNERLKAIENARLDSIRLADEERLALASKYNIIVGAFITPEYARAWLEEYRSRGYDAKLIPMEGSRFELVSAEAYDKVGKAIKRLNQFQDTIQIDAWIYRKN